MGGVRTFFTKKRANGRLVKLKSDFKK